MTNTKLFLDFDSSLVDLYNLVSLVKHDTFVDVRTLTESTKTYDACSFEVQHADGSY